MRIEDSEVEVILRVIKVIDPLAEVWLYGSRASNLLKGGDIDLMVFSSKLRFTDKISILSDIKLELGDQKIDLLIKNPEDKGIDPWVSSILPAAIRLDREVMEGS